MDAIGSLNFSKKILLSKRFSLILLCLRCQPKCVLKFLIQRWFSFVVPLTDLIQVEDLFSCEDAILNGLSVDMVVRSCWRTSTNSSICNHSCVVTQKPY